MQTRIRIGACVATVDDARDRCGASSDLAWTHGFTGWLLTGSAPVKQSSLDGLRYADMLLQNGASLTGK
jgi:hypothetical protein